jgi:SAM-dependent methyltransferase
MPAERRRGRRAKPAVVVEMFRDAVASEGAGAALRRSLAYVADIPRRRRALRGERQWDRLHGVDTAGIVPLQSLAIESENRRHGVRYEATSPAVFRRIVDALSIRHEDFTLVDVGAGKGRVLLLAAEYPFRRVVGVEFSRELVEVATRNLAGFRGGTPACTDVRIVCADATDFPLPPGDLVLFFFNPFAKPVMRVFLERVLASLADAPRRVYIVLRGGTAHAAVVEEAGFRLLPDESREAATDVFVWPLSSAGTE